MAREVSSALLCLFFPLFRHYMLLSLALACNHREPRWELGSCSGFSPGIGYMVFLPSFPDWLIGISDDVGRTPVGEMCEKGEKSADFEVGLYRRSL